MVLDYKNILENKTYLELLKTVPLDIADKINSLENVARFQFKEYPKDVITDNTRNHTLRCINLANITEFGIAKDILLRTLWIHDIPELITNDITVVEKYRKENAEKKFEIEEISAAKELLSEEDQLLLGKFNNANNFLKGNTTLEDSLLSIDFIIAKIIDNSEGNLTFHYYISNWVASNKYDEKLLPPIDSLRHSFITNIKFIDKIKKELPKEQSEVIIKFIELILETITGFWNKVPVEKIPNVIKEYINKHE
jgi:hypothetical protein